jgi:LmbE family N-acetylglucosaminyl deacetylase
MRKFGLSLTGLLIVVASNGVVIRSEDTPNSQMLKTDLLVVTAHPDDESMMAATMARYADLGKVVGLVTCTHGEGGGNGTGKESGPALGVVRDAELRKCLSILGVRHLYYLNQLDWAYTESVRATLVKWGHEESMRRLTRLVRLLRPEIICTMDPAPVGGQHGHHQAAGRLATEVFEAAADPSVFPELNRDEGLIAWRVRKLYWFSFGGASTVHIATDGKAQGALAASSPGKRYADIGWEAARQHRSQGFDKFLASLTGKSGALPPARPNGFLLVKSRVLVNPLSEKDLFDGLAGARLDGADTQHDILAASLPPPAKPPEIEAHLRPRNNVLNYRDWLKTNGISRLMTRLPAHVTVVQGKADNGVDVEVINHSADAKEGTVSVQVPTGWQLEKSELPYSLPAHAMAVVHFECAVPPDTPVKGYDVTVQLGEAKDTGKLDVVPALVVKRLTETFPVDAEISKWESANISSIPIPHTNSFQRGVAGPQECSGRFFVGHDHDGLQVVVDVTDDTVARNITPDDLKAHWRSTSVEICLDPTPPSENTFSTFKLGIFPQDTTGTVQGARDADAHPGWLTRIHSKIRLASRITTAGYIVEAHIPWAEVGNANGHAIRSGNAIGFNVILYHAGKKEARIGEDVGKSRLAWSFWPGVPGRPEVWGLAKLE